jgi:hypothetical protein
VDLVGRPYIKVRVAFSVVMRVDAVNGIKSGKFNRKVYYWITLVLAPTQATSTMHSATALMTTHTCAGATSNNINHALCHCTDDVTRLCWCQLK